MRSALGVTLLAALVVGIHLGAVWALPTAGDDDIRWLEDDHDRQVYYMRGSFLPRGQVPFLEVQSEYPELATWSFAIPYLFMHAPSDPWAYLGVPPMPVFERYANLHSSAMALCLVLLIFVSAKLCIRLGRDPRWALLLLLPSTMFFALSRFDALPALVISTALLCLLHGKDRLAVFVLSLAVLTKWYPIVFLPFFLNYAKVRLGRPILPLLAISAATAAAIVAVTFVSGGRRYVELNEQGRWPPRYALPGRPNQVVTSRDRKDLEPPPLPASIARLVGKLPASAQQFATGGARAVLAPYLAQGGRVSNPGGLYQQIGRFWFQIPDGSPTETTILRVLAALQFGVALFGFVVPVRTDRQLVLWMCLGTVMFVLFAKFFSPQWVMWITALALLFVRGPWLVGTAVFLELFIYAHFVIIRGTSLRGPRMPDTQIRHTDFWYHCYDVRIAATALFMVLVAAALVRSLRARETSPVPTIPA